MNATQSGGGGADAELFERLEQYPWHTDDEFQSGLQAILGQGPDPSQAEALTLRAQCFYFARKFGTSVDFPAYQEWHRQRAPAPEAHAPPQAGGEQPQPQVGGDASGAGGAAGPVDAKPPYPVSFAQVVELISTGQPIPGIKDIPDTVLEGQASESSAQARKKPWEH